MNYIHLKKQSNGDIGGYLAAWNIFHGLTFCQSMDLLLGFGQVSTVFSKVFFVSGHKDPSNPPSWWWDACFWFSYDMQLKHVEIKTWKDSTWWFGKSFFCETWAFNWSSERWLIHSLVYVQPLLAYLMLWNIYFNLKVLAKKPRLSHLPHVMGI